uniref:Glycine-rich cell wall structural protein 1.0-like n=1 Tax=Diabrotica virgifera virgifera TaxID=50390 RepID=A0A6P7GG68_DIAVI
MASRFLIASFLVLTLLGLCLAGGHGGGEHKRVIIHVPFKVKHIHHTHTVVKHVGHEGGGGGGGEEYKVIGYSGGIDDGEVVAHGGGGGGDFGGHGHGWEGGIGGGSIGGGHGIEIGHAGR